MELIIPLLIAIISYFASKKSGAEDATALGVAAAAGIGSYYVATETEWGKGVISDLDGAWKNLIGEDEQPVLDSDGNPIRIPVGSTPVLDKDGNYTYDSFGNVVVKGIETTGKVLESWGGAGTAAVVGTTALATNGLSKYIPWVAGAAILVMVAK